MPLLGHVTHGETSPGLPLPVRDVPMLAARKTIRWRRGYELKWDTLKMRYWLRGDRPGSREVVAERCVRGEWEFALRYREH